MALRWPDPTPTLTLTREERDALYPVDDDEPMTSSYPHFEALLYAVAATRHHLRDVDCLVAGDFAIYYDPVPPGSHGPGPSVVPDLLVAFDVTLDRDTSYCLWEVGKMPELVMEMTSKSTQAMDQDHKPELYAQLGVQEYWQYDPHGGYLNSRLQGWQLVGSTYQPIPGQQRPDLGAELFPSAVLDTSWGHLLDSGDLRLWNPEEQTWYRSPDESQLHSLQEHQARLAEAQRANAEAQRANAEAQRADAEAQARRTAEAEVARLQAYLDTLTKGT